MFNSNLYPNPSKKAFIFGYIVSKSITRSYVHPSARNFFYFPILNLSVKNLSKIRYLIIKKLFAFIVFPTSRKLCTSICTPCKLEKNTLKYLISLKYNLYYQGGYYITTTICAMSLLYCSFNVSIPCVPSQNFNIIYTI